MNHFDSDVIDSYVMTKRTLERMKTSKLSMKEKQGFVERILNQKKKVKDYKNIPTLKDRVPYYEADFKALMDHKKEMHLKGLTIYGNPLKR
ncbi:hypothetical protein [Acholeplasma hippikon]|uniref:Uncharacterized protein n=1 Tax=Acholeplasma hippikon TaxID=264636 RepID=A0A449BJY3_9MOLU|nr:hypothetical protein [Acholeplasma hippikon]VEU82762.1 Uncharacterised protein [Acholeplasma hippikon]